MTVRIFLIALTGLAGVAGMTAHLSLEKRVEGKEMTRSGRPISKRYDPNWESLKRYHVPRWYLDAKFGIFIHWGVYSVPAFGNEWYPRNMYQPDSPENKHHLASYGTLKTFGYKDFIPMFKAEKWDPNHWADLFKKSGAKYVVPVAEHHDGFPMYDSKLTEWCAGKMGPKRDIVGELSKAVRERGLHFGVSSHRAEHWWFFNSPLDSDVRDPRFAGLYAPAQPEKSPLSKAHLDNWFARCTELVDKYHPDLVWFDWWIEQPAFQPYLQRFAADYYNRAAKWGGEGIINFKNKSFPEDAAVLDIERGRLGDKHEQFWQTDTSVGKKSWGYIQDEEFKPADEIVDELVDIVSKNGCLLLNIGPRSDGTIPEETERLLLDIGKWLSVNGKAIYGTRPWRVYGEGPTKEAAGSFGESKNVPYTAQDIRFTSGGKTLYAIALAWPQDRLVIKTLAEGNPNCPEKIGSVRLLGSHDKLTWSRTGDGLQLNLPKTKPGDYAYAFEIRLK